MTQPHGARGGPIEPLQKQRMQPLFHAQAMEELMWTVLVFLTAINLLVNATTATQAKIALFSSQIVLSMLTRMQQLF